MKYSVKDSDLRKMAPEQLAETLKKIVAAMNSPLNGELKELEERIQEYEKEFEVSSDILQRELAQGKRQETWPICKWLMLIHERELLEHASRPNPT